MALFKGSDGRVGKLHPLEPHSAQGQMIGKFDSDNLGEQSHIGFALLNRIVRHGGIWIFGEAG